MPGRTPNLGFLLAFTGQPQAGIEHLQEALRLDPELEEAHNNLGFVLMSVGQLPAAIEEYHQALRLKPNFVDAWTNLAYAEARLGHSEEALFAAGRALEIAKAQDQTAIAQHIETWLQSYRARLANPPAATETPNSAQRQP